MVAWRWGIGSEKCLEGDYKRHKKMFGAGNGEVYYLDCGDGFEDVCW